MMKNLKGFLGSWKEMREIKWRGLRLVIGASVGSFRIDYRRSLFQMSILRVISYDWNTYCVQV